VRLVGPNGEQVGIVRVEDALRLAQEADLDLVEVAPQARPPVCKLMDFGKFKYESAIKEREARKNQAHTVLKEIRLRLKIDPHDYGTKKGHVERFLSAGDKVKVMIMFRGREQSRPEMGYRLLQRMAADVAELGYVESSPKQDGRNMIMVIGPHKKKAETKTESKSEQKAARPRRHEDEPDELDESTDSTDSTASEAPAEELVGVNASATPETPAEPAVDEDPIFVRRTTPAPPAPVTPASGFSRPASGGRPPSGPRTSSGSRPPSSGAPGGMSRPSSAGRPPAPSGRPAPTSSRPAPAGRPPASGSAPGSAPSAPSAPSGPAPSPSTRPAAAPRPVPPAGGTPRPGPSPRPAAPRPGPAGAAPRPTPSSARPTPGAPPKPGPRPGPAPTPPAKAPDASSESEQAAADA
jgi:translation initiation factor IF-3